MADTCLAPDCNRPAAPRKGGLCEGHAWQRRNGQPLRPLRPYGDAWQTLQRAIRDRDDCPTGADWDAEFYRRQERVKKAGQRFRLAARGQSPGRR